jgi:hypothetical protein
MTMDVTRVEDRLAVRTNDRVRARWVEARGPSGDGPLVPGRERSSAVE